MDDYFKNRQPNGTLPNEKPVAREPKPLSDFNAGFNGNIGGSKKKSWISSWGKREVSNLNDELGKNNIPYKLFNVKYISVLLSSIMILLGLLVFTFIYFANGGYFSPTLVDNSTCINNPSVCNCNYNLSCGTQNVTLQFPSSLTLNIDNINITKYNQTCLTSCLKNITNSR